MSTSRSLLLTLSLVVPSAGCHYGAISTVGTTYASQQYDNPWERAARESGAHDLRCPNEPIKVMALQDGKYPSSEYAADGCGQRAVYKCSPASLSQTCEMLLVARFPK